MKRSLTSLIGLIVFLVIIVGAGILIYRFVTNDSAQVATLIINRDGKFALSEYKFTNDEVFKVQNNSDKNQTIKKSSDKTTLVEINSSSTSRELSLSDNTTNELYLAGDESQKTKVTVGAPKEAETKSTPEARQETGSTQGTNTSTQTLPTTGPENNLIFVTLAFAGLVLYRISRKLLN